MTMSGPTQHNPTYRTGSNADSKKSMELKAYPY